MHYDFLRFRSPCPSGSPSESIKRHTAHHDTALRELFTGHAQYELARTQPRPPRYTRGGLVNDVREGRLRPRTRGPLRRVPPVLCPPPRHPGRVSVRGRRGSIGLEAQLIRRLEDAIHQEVLAPVVAVLAHDRAELSQLAIQDPRDRVPPKHHDLVRPW